MSEIVERVEAATEKLAAQQQRLAASLTALGEFDHHFHAESLHEAQEAVTELESAVRNLGIEAGNLPGHVEELFDREVGAISAAANDAYGDLSARWSGLEKALAQLIEALDRLPEHTSGQLRAFPDLLDAHQGRLLAANNELVAAIEGICGSLEGPFASQVDQSGQDLEKLLLYLQQELREKIGSRWENLAGNGKDQLQRTFTDMSELADRGGQDLRREAEAVFNAFDEEMRRAIDQKLPDAQRELIEHAARALGEEIIEGIAMSTIGAQVSGAMSPYLAYVIAVKQALELLLRAIRIFKDPLGEIF